MSNFKEWLVKNGFDKYSKQLQADKIETIDDLTFLAKDEIIDLSRKLGMSLQERRKLFSSIQSINNISFEVASPPAYPGGGKKHEIPSSLLCKEHNQPLALVCTMDNSLLCMVCVATTHSQHPLISIQKAFKEENDEIMSLIEKTKRRASALEESIVRAKATQAELDKRGALTKKTIQTFCNKARQAWNDRERKLLVEVDDMLRYKSKVLSQQVDSLSLAHQDIGRLVHESKNVLPMHDQLEAQTQLLQIGRVLRKRLGFLSEDALILEPETGSNIIFTADPSLLAPIASAGEVSDMSALPEYTTAKGSGLVRTRPGEPTNFIIIAKDKDGKQLLPGVDVFTVEIANCKANIEIHDKRHGTYEVEYQLSADENCTSTELSVLLYGKHVQGSPFKLTINRECRGIFTRMWGSYGIDMGQFKNAYGVAVNANAVYVVDVSNYRIQVFLRDGTFVEAWGTRGAGKGEFSHSFGLAADDDGVYVADFGLHRIQVFLPDGTFLRMWGEEGCEHGQLRAPYGIAVDGDEVFVADYSNDRIQVFTKDGTFLRTWGSRGYEAGELSGPYDVAVNGDLVYVVDANNNRIQVFNRDGTFVRMWGSEGSEKGQLGAPYGVAVYRDNVYVVEQGNNRVQVFRSDGSFVRMWGSHGTEEGQFSAPSSIAVDEDTVYVAEYSNHRIQVFT